MDQIQNKEPEATHPGDLGPSAPRGFPRAGAVGTRRESSSIVPA